MKQENYIAYDPDNHELGYFETEEEATNWLNELFSDNEFTEEMMDGGYYIAKIIKRSKFNELYNKEDFTDEEWEDEGYSLDNDRIGTIELKSIE